jgi:hypothetical protein
MTLLKHVALAAFCLSAPGLAGAQCRLCEQPAPGSQALGTGADIELEVETSLDFDRMIVSTEGTGAATIRPDGSTGVEGAVVELGPRASVGTVLVHGEPNRIVRIDVPRRIDLFSAGGGHVTLDDVTIDVPTISHLDAAGRMSFRFGGRIILYGDSDGPYRGDLPITVEYQ